MCTVVSVIRGYDIYLTLSNENPSSNSLIIECRESYVLYRKYSFNGHNYCLNEPVYKLFTREIGIYNRGPKLYIYTRI